MDEIRRNRKQKIEEARLRSWSSLPGDILRKIFRKLFFRDILCSAAVCKGWKIPNPKPNSLPWRMEKLCGRVILTGKKQLSLEFEFYEPYNPEPYCFKKSIDLPEEEEGTEYIPYNRHVLDSKFGWFLGVVKKKLERTKEPVEYYSFFLYTPFAKKCSSNISPPLYLHHNSHPLKMMATFSSHPTSPECVVFLVLSCCEGKTEIHTWRNGQDTWNKYLVNWYQNIVNSIVHINGFLYCANRGGSLGIFNSSDGTWKITSPCFHGDETRSHHRQQLAESNGELLLVCATCDNKYCVYKYDISRNAWVRKLRLDDQVLFLDFWIRRALSVPVNAGEEGMQMANRVYGHPLGGKVLYFSLEDNKWHLDHKLFVASCFPWEYKKSWFILPF